MSLTNLKEMMDGSLDLQASLNEMNQKQRQNFMATIGNTDAGGSAEIERHGARNYPN